jgi:hypothetical protein
MHCAEGFGLGALGCRALVVSLESGWGWIHFLQEFSDSDNRSADRAVANL